jgi:hypothetical protein
MRQEEKAGGTNKPQLFTKDGKPLRVLSTSLGIALLANAFIGPMASGEAPQNSSADTGTVSTEAKLVEWSTEAVKPYYDSSVDWNIPLKQDEAPPAEGSSDANGGTTGTTGTAGGGTAFMNSGFGWDDLLLYHLIFNRGSAYSSSTWYSNRPVYNSRNGTPYKPRSYNSDVFQNKPVAGSAVRPTTTDRTGSVTRRSTSSSKGGIGGTSSGLSSSSSSSSKSSGSSGGFGG